MEIELWFEWKRNWEWILQCAQKKGWQTFPVTMAPTVSMAAFAELEAEIGQRYPDDFKEVLTRYAGGLGFYWWMDGERGPEEFRPVFSGGGYYNTQDETENALWGFSKLKELWDDLEDWKTNCFNNPDDDYDKVYYDKLPFIEVPNGDFIAFDYLDGNSVVYLSHDDDEMHGYRLAESFVEFITLWSNIGCVGTECRQMKPFYDEAAQKLLKDAPVIERWKAWLES